MERIAVQPWLEENNYLLKPKSRKKHPEKKPLRVGELAKNLEFTDRF